MRALFSLLVIHLLIQLPGPNQWQPVTLIPDWAGEAQVRSVDADDPRLPLNVGDLDEKVIRVQLFEDDVVHDDALPDSLPVSSAAMSLRCGPPDEPHLERDIPPPQCARVTRAQLAS